MSYEGIHNVHKIKIAHDFVKETGRKTIDLTAQFDVTAWSDTPTLTEKEITFFLAESFEGIVFDREPSSLEDRKAAAQEAIEMFEHDHDLIMYIAELYRRLETADPTFSLDG
mgnify:CR=1 FL=1